MGGERDNGATFALDQIGWIDFESRGRVDIKAGTYRYATEADAIVLAYAIGGGPVHRIAVPDFSQPLSWIDLPLALQRHAARVWKGEAVFAAWNAAFDKAIWNYAMLDGPVMQPHYILDVMAQAVASGLPPDLSAAAKASGSELKETSGKELIKLFCLPSSTATPQSHPAEWGQFLDYATQDIEAMRSVWLGTRQLPLAEWREYWAMEAINERGVGIDLPMVTHAAALADEDKERSKAELRQLTGDPKMTVDMVARLTKWLLQRLPVEGRAILTKRDEEVDEDGAIVKPAKHALTRRQVERLIAYVKDVEKPHSDPITVLHSSDAVMRVLQIRLYGGSKTPQKFRRMLDSHVDGVLFGQYVFNGAAQTGRASSRGVQVHNLARDVLEDEPEAIESLLYGEDYDRLAKRRPDPVSRQLSLLIRPAFVPANDRVFVWSDWSQIEARVLPWLCDYQPGSRQRLQIFRDVDADPSVPDLYTRTAAQLSQVVVGDVTKPMRQRGKVAELALGFCGGVNALQSMAAAYGMHLSDAEARTIVNDWREANPWSRDFSRDLWEAMRRAEKLPGIPQPVGRVAFVFLRDYLGGSLLCVLPSGRCLTYRACRWEWLDVNDVNDQPTGERKLELTFARGHGRLKLWPGMFVENVTQAVAADVLRGTLRRLEDSGAFDVRLHTHDEILLECPHEAADTVSAQLREIMRQGFGWSEGLPLMSEETTGYYYSKHEGSHGL